MKNQIEERLIDFAVSAIKIKEDIVSSFEATHLFNQLARSATAVPLAYAESNGAESLKDFIHKLSIAVKELRESKVNLQIMSRAGLISNHKKTDLLIDEASQLISILIKSIQTTKTRYPNIFKGKSTSTHR